MAKKNEETPKKKKNMTKAQLANLKEPWKKGDIPNPFGLPLIYDEQWANYTAELILKYVEKTEEPYIDDFYYSHKDKIKCVFSTFHEKIKSFSVLSDAISILKVKERKACRSGFRDGSNNKYYEFMLGNLGFKNSPETQVTVQNTTNVTAKTVENLEVLSDEDLEKLESIYERATDDSEN